MKDRAVCFGGVDWATDAHAVAVVDETGQVLDEFEVDHSAEGLGELCRRLGKHGVARVAIERPDGPIVEALLERFEVVVVPSRSVRTSGDSRHAMEPESLRDQGKWSRRASGVVLLRDAVSWDYAIAVGSS